MTARVLGAMLVFYTSFAGVAPALADSGNADVRAMWDTSIRVVIVQVDPYASYPTQRFMRILGTGSGFAISSDHVVTNYHVARKAIEYPAQVVLVGLRADGGKPVMFRTVAYDSARDLAALKVENDTLSPATLLDAPLVTGEEVHALGYPRTVDILSSDLAKGTSAPPDLTDSIGHVLNLNGDTDAPSAYLHDAAMAHGNSGGSLVDACGRVVGVNRAQTATDGGDTSYKEAISSAVLIDFLKHSQLGYSAVQTPCQPMAEYIANQKAQADQIAETARIKTEKAHTDQLAAMQQFQNQWRKQMGQVAIIGMAGIIGLIGFLALRGTPRQSLATGLVYIGIGCLAGAAFLLLRMPTAATPAKAEEQVRTASANGKLFCTFDAEQSRLTISTPQPIELDWSPGGCVNGRTQYVGKKGGYDVVLAPAHSRSISRFTFDPSDRTLVLTLYHLREKQAAAMRALVPVDRSCTSDQAALLALDTAETRMEAALPDTFNERLVYNCGR